MEVTTMISAYAAVLLVLAAAAAVVEWSKTHSLIPIVLALMSLGVAAAFFFSGHAPIWHP